MTNDIAEALAAFRKFNYENIYLRPASKDQARSVISMLQALVEHYTSNTHLIPVDELLDSSTRGNNDDAVFAAVSWVSGMTDRYACRQASELLGWLPEQLPAGIGV
jgi:dGTPase